MWPICSALVGHTVSKCLIFPQVLQQWIKICCALCVFWQIPFIFNQKPGNIQIDIVGKYKAF